MSNSYNAQDTELFPSTKVKTGIVLKHGARYFAPRRFAPAHKRCFAPDSMRHFATCST